MADRRSEIDAWFAGQEEERQPTTPALGVLGETRTPDEVAQERVIADEVGQPPQAVRAYPDLFARSAEVSRTNRSTEGSPRLRAWLAEPQNFEVARDDVENLSTFERLRRDAWRGVQEAHFNAARFIAGTPREGATLLEHANPTRFFRQGEEDLEYGRLAFRAHQAQLGRGEALSDEDRARMDALATREGQDDWGPFIIGPTARLLPQVLGAFERGGRQAAARFDETWEDPFAVQEGERLNARRVLEGVAAAPILAVASGVSSFGGAVGGYLSFGNEQETGIAYDQMLRAGVDAQIAAERATQYGAWATGIEFVGEALGLKLSGATRLATRGFLQARLLEGGAEAAARRAGSAIVGTAIDQGAEEAAQELAQIIHQDLALQETQGRAADVGEAWRSALSEESIKQILMAGYIGAQAGGGMAAVPAGANFALDLRAAQQAEHGAAVFEEQTRAAQASKLTERGLGSTLENAIGAMDESQVYIDADKFIEHFQGAGVNAYAVADELGIGAERLAQAVVSHSQVQIPTARFAARVLRVPAHASLSEHVRVEPTADTPAEAKAAGERIQADIERLVEETASLQSDNEIGAAVETRMRELFAAAAEEGGPRAEVSARYAKLVAALPRAVLARARQADSEYATRLEGQLRKLFGSDLDIAGPGRGIVATPGTELEQRPAGVNSGPVRNDRWDAPAGVKLTERQRSIVEMAVNGASNEWIAEEWETSRDTIKATLSRVKRQLGGNAPWERSFSPGQPADVPTEMLVRARDRLVEAGHSNINATIAEQFNTTRENVKVRLWRYDREQKKREAEAVRDPEPQSAMEARRAWVDSEVVLRPQPGGLPGDLQHGFILTSGRRMHIGIGDDGNGAAAVDWTFMDRLEAQDPTDSTTLYADGDERLSVSEWRDLRTAIQAVVEADAAKHERPAYVFTPERTSNRRANLKMADELGALGYDLLEDQGSVYLFRPGAGIANNGRIKPQDGWDPNFEEPIEYGSQEEADDAQRAYYAAVREIPAERSTLGDVARATLRERQEAAASRAAAEEVAAGVQPRADRELKQGEHWKRAEEAGLPMDQESRMARARDLGFTGPWYTGANRLDRLTERGQLLKNRASSGPLPFFTDSTQVATGYAEGKPDASHEVNLYNEWFLVRVGRGKAKTLDQAWFYLEPEERATLTKKLAHVTEEDSDQHGGTFTLEGDGPGGARHWDYTLRQHRGNALAAAQDLWLDSGILFGREELFLDVLKAAGFTHKIEYNSPHVERPGILPAMIRARNPLDTSDRAAMESFREALAQAAKGKRRKKPLGYGDQWKKQNYGLREFLEAVDEDLKNDTSYAWTAIPDEVTALLQSLGYDGVLDTGGKFGGGGPGKAGTAGEHRVFIPFEPNQVRSINAAFNPENVDSADILAQGGEKGAIRFDPNKWRAGEFDTALIRLTESADLSTFLHESGHLFHLILESVAGDQSAPAELRSMWDSTLGWFGVSPEQWAAMDMAARTPYYERWAETFEAYLMEGKAPSLSLREAFATFKQWLTQIYRSVLGIQRANLTPEIRDVFDRLLATDDEIAEARAAMGSDFALARDAFKTDEEFAQYQQAIAEARDAQEAELRARAMDAYARKSKRWWRGERERVRDAASRYVDSEPARRAEQWLAFEEWRALAPTEMTDEGELGYVAPANALEEIPEGLPTMKLSPEALARDWPDANLPVSLRPRTDPEAVLAEAMSLKAQDKGRGALRAQRLSSFIRKAGGIQDPEGRIKAALGSGRARPGLINNATGKTPAEMLRLVVGAGYFGEGAARELKQDPNGPDAGPLHAGIDGPSLQDLVDDGGFGPGGGSASLVIGALRRARVNLSRLESTGLSERPMPRRSVPIAQVRRTDHTPVEQRWVDEYVQTPGEPIIVRQNKRGGFDIIDGHHRLAAAQARGETNIEVFDASLYFGRDNLPTNAPDGGAAPAETLPDGMLREIDDSGARVNFPAWPAPTRTYRLSELLEHDELYAVHPELRDFPVVVGDARLHGGRYGTAGFADGERLLVDPSGTREFTGRKDLPSFRALIAHELQHVVDRMEGRAAQGGSPDWLRQNVILPEGVTPQQAYERLGTEQTAFATERRIGMTAEQRASSDPFTEAPIGYRSVPLLRGFLNAMRRGEMRQLEAYELSRPNLARTAPNGSARHPGFELFQKDDVYGVNDRGLVERFRAKLRKEAEFAQPAGPGFINIGIYPERFFNQTNEMGVARTNMNYGEGQDANWDFDPVLQEAWDAMSLQEQLEVTREIDGDDALSQKQRMILAALKRQQFRSVEGDGDFDPDVDAFGMGEGWTELYSSKQPDLEEFMAALIADLKGERAVYSARDKSATAQAQDLEDARAWFESHNIDLSKDKEEIRAQIVAALEADRASENQWEPDDVAPWFGFESGSALVDALQKLKPRAVAVEERIDSILQEEFGDAGSRAKIEETARLAAHAEVQAKRIEVELAAIQKATGGRVRPVGEAAKRYAQQQIEGMSLREIRNADVFLAGERRSARAAFDAAKKQDWPEAERAKSRQLLSFWLFKYARDASERLDRMEARWKRYSTSQTTRAAIGPRHIEQIDAILDTIETGKPQFRPSQTLAEWAENIASEEGVLPDELTFNPDVIEQVIRRRLSEMEYRDVLAVDDTLRNIEHIGRGMIRLRQAREAQRIADIKDGLKARVREEWAPQLSSRRSLAAPDAADKIKRQLRFFHASMLKMDFLARYMDGVKDGGPWMALLGTAAQQAENDKTARMETATRQFMDLTRAHYTPSQFRQMLTKRIHIEAIGDSRTKMQLISYALNRGARYNFEALLRGEGWDEQTFWQVVSSLDRNDWAYVQALWSYVEQWKEESFALNERTKGVRPEEVLGERFQLPNGAVIEGKYWPVSFDAERSDAAAQREARDTVLSESGGSFRQPSTPQGRLISRRGTGGQALSSDFLGVLAKHVHDTIQDITHRELVITVRRVKADKELRDMIARVMGRDAVRALDAWTHRMAEKLPAQAFGDWGRLPAYLRRAATAHAMGFKVSVATLNLLGHLQAIPRNGVIPQLKQAGITLAVGFPDLLRRYAMAFGTGHVESSARVRFVQEKSEMMRAHMRGHFDRDINDMQADMVGRREGAILPKRIEDALHILNTYTNQIVGVPTWLAAYETAINGEVNGVAPANEEAAVGYADSVVRMTISAGAAKDLSALIASNNQWQRIWTLFMNWANIFYNQMFAEQVPGVLSGKVSPARFAANMVWIWLLPGVITAMFYGHADREDDEDEFQYWARMSATIGTYPLQTIPLVRDAIGALVQGYRAEPPVSAVIERAARLKTAIEDENERQIVKQGFLLAGQATGIPTQVYTTADYMVDLAQGEEDPTEDPVDALEEALLRDTR